ncbi:type II secretion system protein [Aliarcobacter butzleri]|uniref:type II secretion system protein n=1 Tax=Aliarcobacter butzleri TaxID=28197 RepID=UPI0021B2B951|nr:type II secretion system protein [Aliarcobacter butzleri]MCT7596099.1 type II secretion system GspH family protein [Aliarcobacter butzleri]
MNTKNKKAFSLIELLFSLIILAALFSIAAPNFIEKNYYEQSLKSKEELSNAIKTQLSYFEKNQEFLNFEETKSSGMNINIKDISFTLNKDHKLLSETQNCDNGTIGLYMKLTFEQDRKYEYNSCTDKIIVRALN